MVSSDTVVGIVGAVILTGAMIAVFYYENSNADDAQAADLGEGAELFAYDWERASHPHTEPGNANDGQSVEIPVHLGPDFAESWVYAINVSLTWTDDQAATPVNAEDTFKIELLDENGEVVAGTDAGASPREIKFTIAVAKPPSVDIASDDQAGANETLISGYNATGGEQVSKWKFRVTLVSTNTQDPVGPIGGQVDPGNSFDLAYDVGHWKPVPA